MKSLNTAIAAFLKTKEKTSSKTYRAYSLGIDPLKFYITNYAYEDFGRNSTVDDIETHQVDHLLSYFIISKYLDSGTFRLNTARAVSVFFTYMSKQGLYDDNKAKVIRKMAAYYLSQYPRLEKLEGTLRESAEGEINAVMKLPKKQQEAAIAELKRKAVGQIVKDVGYVEVTAIEDKVVFGDCLTELEKIGPVALDDESLKLVQVGDTINMIALVKQPSQSAWEIAELGYVYPKPYFETDEGSKYSDPV